MLSTIRGWPRAPLPASFRNSPNRWLPSRAERQDIGRLVHAPDLEQQFAAASIGTTGVVAPGRNDYGSLTTPDPVALHKLLAELAGAGVTHAAMEASSHGLDQRRLDGVRLFGGRLLNLGRDYMDYHPTHRGPSPRQAEVRLFDTLLPKGAPAVIFADDPWSQPTIDAATAAGLTVLTVGRRGGFLAPLKRRARAFQAARRDRGGRRHP